MSDAVSKPFQVLALSGGGFRGLYTAKIIADIEREIDAPLATRFDLITGTSIGGILALALALEIPAQRIVDLFINHGEEIFRKRWSLNGLVRAPYSPVPLKRLLSTAELFGDRLLGEATHPVIVPSLNYSTGEPVIFKTPHHVDFKRDHQHRIVDVALATSAAPAYFPRHVFDNCQYVDGGLYANAPGLLGVHEAQKFFGRDVADVRLLAVGTMSSRFTVDPRQNRDGGVRDWGGWSPIKMSRRLFGLSISAQEVLTDFMLSHRLDGGYLHVDDPAHDERARAVALDAAGREAREVLLGAATQRSKACISKSEFKTFLEHSPSKPVFFYGENANRGSTPPC
jgi:predicted acylesterase/phospholipase RssA